MANDDARPGRSSSTPYVQGSQANKGIFLPLHLGGLLQALYQIDLPGRASSFAIVVPHLSPILVVQYILHSILLCHTRRPRQEDG